MKAWQPLILRKNSWSKEEGGQVHGPSGVQLISGQLGWKEVYIRAVFYSRTISEQDKERIESSFKDCEGKFKLTSSSRGDYLMTGASLEDELGDWTSPKFCIKIKKQPDKIACDIATHIAILHHSRDNPQMDADGRRIGETRQSAARIVQLIQGCYMINLAEAVDYSAS